jgi:RsiW-degrading membrane proteinase PrsW (M82 family)
MVYIPTPPTQTACSLELTRRLRETIHEYQAREAKLTEADIQFAVQSIQIVSAATTRKVKLFVIAAVVAGLAFAGAFAAFAYAQATGRNTPVILIVTMAVVGSVIALLLIMRTSSD